ncbi:MAG: DUF952 domain-containing protein [Pseudomonadota bacterium]
MSNAYPSHVFKICSEQEWSNATRFGTYTGSSDDHRDGFIHLSTAAQLPETAAKHFHGQDNLVLISLSTSALGAQLKWEPSRGGALFPHLYSALDPEIADDVRRLALDADGIPQIPNDILTMASQTRVDPTA